MIEKRKGEETGYKLDWILASIVFLGLLVLMFLVFIIYEYDKLDNNDCLTNFAKSYCEEQNRTFKGTYWEFEPKFLCYGENRKGSSQESFYFLDEEVEECAK